MMPWCSQCNGVDVSDGERCDECGYVAGAAKPTRARDGLPARLRRVAGPIEVCGHVTGARLMHEAAYEIERRDRFIERMRVAARACGIEFLVHPMSESVVAERRDDVAT